MRVYLPPCTPRVRVCQSQNHSHQSPQVRSYFMLSRFTTSSFRAARPQPPVLLQNANVILLARMPRQNANVNLLAKMPMSTFSPNYQCQSSRQNAPPKSPSLLLRLVAPVQSSLKNCPTLGILRPMYFLGFDSHSALPISARNASIEPYLAHLATHRPNPF